MTERKHISWPSIENFHCVRKNAVKYANSVDSINVLYRAKVKLHGTNAAIQCHKDGSVFAQSREHILDGVTRDNAGFAAWVEKNKAFWSAIGQAIEEPGDNTFAIIFGEWFGKGIQKGVAASDVEKSFAIFAFAFSDANGKILMGVDPKEIEKTLADISSEKGVVIPSGVFVLPWHEEKKRKLHEVKINWAEEHSKLLPVVDKINELVEEVEKEDPWIKENFGVSGIGEGLVYYPIVGETPDSSENYFKEFSLLAFKAKGEKHRAVKTNKPAQLEPTVVLNTDSFVNLVLTESRLEQGSREVNEGKLEFDKTKIGSFIGWIAKDVFKECQTELSAAGFTWDQVSKQIANKARVWYLQRI